MKLFRCEFFVKLNKLPPMCQTVRATDAGFAYSFFLGWLRSIGALDRGVVKAQELSETPEHGVLLPVGHLHTFDV